MSGIRYGRVEVSCFFLFLCAYLLYRGCSVVILSGLLFCLLHEAGHYAALLMTGNSVRRIYITVSGAQLEPEKSMTYGQELLVAAAGPAVNLLLVCLFCRKPDTALFVGVNLTLGCFNLLPVGELDGAKILRCILCSMLPYETATGICRCLDFSFTVFFCVCGWFLAAKYHNLTLLITVLWLLNRRGEEKSLRFCRKRME